MPIDDSGCVIGPVFATRHLGPTECLVCITTYLGTEYSSSPFPRHSVIRFDPEKPSRQLFLHRFLISVFFFDFQRAA